MTNEEALRYIELIEKSTIFYDESLDYQLSSFDLDWLELARKALESIDKMPTADIVRCKDCVHRRKTDNWCAVIARYREEDFDDWFCADGELEEK